MNENRIKLWFVGLIVAMLIAIIVGLFYPPTNKGMIAIVIFGSIIGAISSIMVLRFSRSQSKVGEPYLTIIMAIAIFGFIGFAAKTAMLFDHKWLVALQSWFQSSPGL